MTEQSIFIANRGEIAVRIIRAARDLGIRSIAMFTPEERNAVFAGMADEAYEVPPRAANGQSPYLDIEAIVSLAVRAGATHLHPGYGFLSENADFADAVATAGITWIGPSAAAIEALGDKIAARQIAERVGAPLIRGISHPVTDLQEVVDFAATVGLPLAVKASHGGGGRGMRIIRTSEEIERRFTEASQEALAAFGNGECFVEQFIDFPRHIETQCLADAHGNAVVVSTRDCSLQRRHQKLVEEAPAPGLTPEQIGTLTGASKRLLLAAGYVGAATCEFLLSRNGALSFLEVNTRLQVEHPVTEQVTGVDLVREQIRIANGEALTLTDNAVTGHAIEFRINCEDPDNEFFPSIGAIETYQPPEGPGIRIDSGVRAGSAVSGAFDSMVAKLIVTGADRAETLARARRALTEFRLGGVDTVLPFFRALLETDAFVRHGTAPDTGIDTEWLERDYLPGHAPFASGSAATATDTSPAPDVEFPLVIDGRRHTVSLPAGILAPAAAPAVGAPAAMPTAPRILGLNATTVGPDIGAPAAHAGEAVIAPAQAAVVRVLADTGAGVQAGDPLVVIEAMKMEHTVDATATGTVEIVVSPGDAVSRGDALAYIS